MTRHLQERLREETKRLRNEQWDKTINDLQEKYREPQQFWKAVRRPMGTDKDRQKRSDIYILDANGRKRQADEEKHFVVRFGINIFRITDEEYLKF